MLDGTEKLQKRESRGWKQGEHMRDVGVPRCLQSSNKCCCSGVGKLDIVLKIPSVDDPFVVSKVTEFYNHLYGLSMVKCTQPYFFKAGFHEAKGHTHSRLIQ